MLRKPTDDHSSCSDECDVEGEDYFYLQGEESDRAPNDEEELNSI